MPTLLRIDSSVSGPESRTRRLTEAFAEAWLARGESFRVVSRDLHEDPLPQLRSAAQHWPERLRGGLVLDRETAAMQEGLIDELCAADAVLLGAPMYNSAMPATLKSWVDLVHVPGVTAPFDVPAQPLRGKPLVIATAQGGPAEPPSSEFVTGPLREVFGTGCGMEVHVVATSRTLAELIPELDAVSAAEEFARALERSRELGAVLA